MDELAAFHPRALVDRLRADPLLWNSTIFLAGSLLAGVFGYGFHFATGRLLGPSRYGIVAAAIAGLYLLTVPVLVVQLVTARYTSIAAARGSLGNVRSLLLRVSGISLLAALPVGFLFALFAPAVARYLNIADTRVVYLLAVVMVISYLLTATRGALQGLRRFFALSINAVLDAVTRVVAAVALVLLGLGAFGAVLAVVIGPTLAYVQSLYMVGRLTRGAATDTNVSEGIGRYAVLTAVAGIGINFLFSIDILLAKHYLSSERAGIYAAASVLARVVYFLGVTVAGVMFPEVATLHARDEAHLHIVDRSLLLVSGMGALLAAIYTLLPSLVLLPYGSSFSPVRPYLGAFAVALTLLALANLLMNYFLSVARAHFIVPLAMVCALEPALIALFHRDVWQILGMVLLSTGALLTAIGGLYLRERLAPAVIAQ